MTNFGDFEKERNNYELLNSCSRNLSIVIDFIGVPYILEYKSTFKAIGYFQSLSAPAKFGVAFQVRSSKNFGAALRLALRLTLRSCAPDCALGSERCAPSALHTDKL